MPFKVGDRVQGALSRRHGTVVKLDREGFCYVQFDGGHANAPVLRSWLAIIPLVEEAPEPFAKYKAALVVVRDAESFVAAKREEIKVAEIALNTLRNELYQATKSVAAAQMFLHRVVREDKGTV
jgi:hypothetical protein